MFKKLLFTFLLFLCLSSPFLRADQKRILVASPIRQKPAILKEFLVSLKGLEKITYTLDYIFVDDNVVAESRQILADFAKEQGGKCRILDPQIDPASLGYVCNELTHYWNEGSIWKVAAFKDKMIQEAISNKYDYIFLIDSDLVLHPHTVEQLILADRDIVSNIFWTSWVPNSSELPQVWVSDHYTMYQKGLNEDITPEECQNRQRELLDKLRQPGVYEVGGLGACTLIKRSALEKGLSFKKITNLSIWGEDRHFCIRAIAMGLSLFVDTHYPAYHIYRESYLSGVEDYKKSCKTTRLTLSMVMGNEADHYLKTMLESAREYITDAIIIDDASTDGSVEIVKQTLKGIPLKIVSNKESKFSKEFTLRQQQWDETIATNPDWIVFLDADQIFEQKFKDEVKQLIQDPTVEAYHFRLYDFWDETHYREDSYWRAHLCYRPFLVKYKPGIDYQWKETNQHCGSFPYTVLSFPSKTSELRLKHLGWANAQDRQAKFERYQKLDPGAKLGWKEQYDSILDATPHLVQWVE